MKNFSLKSFFHKFLCLFLIMGITVQNTYAIIDVGLNVDKSSAQIGEEIDYSIIINNSRDDNSTGVNFTHNLQEGVYLSDNPDIRSTCGSTDVISTRNDVSNGVITMTNGEVPGTSGGRNGSCQIKAKIIGTSIGQKNFVFELGSLTGNTGGQSESNNSGEPGRASVNLTRLEGIEVSITNGIIDQRTLGVGRKNAYVYSNQEESDFTVIIESRYLNRAKIDLKGLAIYIPHSLKIKDGTIRNTCGLNIEKGTKSETNLNPSHYRDPNNIDYLKINSGKLGFGDSERYCFIHFTGIDNSNDVQNFYLSRDNNGTIFDSERFIEKMYSLYGGYLSLGDLNKSSSRKARELSDFGEKIQTNVETRSQIYDSHGTNIHITYDGGNYLNIINGVGKKKVRFNFIHYDLNNKTFNFKHQFPLSKDGTGTLTFSKVIENTCSGGEISGQGTREFRVSNITVNGATIDYYRGYGDNSLEQKPNICYVEVEVETSDEGEYLNKLNYKDENLINTKTIGDTLKNCERAECRESYLIAVDSNGLEVQNKRILYSDRETSDSRSTYSAVFGLDNFQEEYTIKNITDQEINFDINSKYIGDYNGNTIEFNIKEIDKGECGGNPIIQGESDGKKRITGISINGGQTCIIKVKKSLKQDIAKLVPNLTEVLNLSLEIRNFSSLYKGEVSVLNKGNKNTKELKLHVGSKYVIKSGLDESSHDSDKRKLKFGEIIPVEITLSNNQREDINRKSVLNYLKIDGYGDFLKFTDEKSEPFIFNNHHKKEVIDYFNSKLNVRVENGSLIIERKNTSSDNIVDFNKNGTIIIHAMMKVKEKGNEDTERIHKSHNRFFSNEGDGHQFYGGSSYTFVIDSNKKSSLNQRNFVGITNGTIKGGEKARVELTIGENDVENFVTNGINSGMLLDLRENLGNFKIFGNGNFGGTCFQSGQYEKTEFNNQLIEGKFDKDSIRVSEDGKSLFIRNIGLGTRRYQNRKTCTISFDVTSVKGGNQELSGGDLYEYHSGHERSTSRATLTILRNFNVNNSFKDKEIYINRKGTVFSEELPGESRKEKTEYKIEFFNSNLNEEIINDFEKGFPSYFDVRLKSNSCGGNVSLRDSNYGKIARYEGLRVSQESTCEVIFEVSGKEWTYGIYDEIEISQGEITTQSGKSNSSSSSTTIKIKKSSGYRIFTGKDNEKEVGSKKYAVLRLMNDRTERNDIANVGLNLTINSGINGDSSDANIVKDSTTEILKEARRIINEGKTQYDFKACNLNNKEINKNKSGNSINLSLSEQANLININGDDYCDILIEMSTDNVQPVTLNGNVEISYENDVSRFEGDIDPIAVNFIDKKITVKHLEEGTNSVVYNEEILNNNGVAKTDNVNYEYVRGEASQDGRVYTHYYQKKNGKVVVKYIDKETSNEIAGKQRYELNLKWGDNYNVENKKDDITNYSYDSTTGEESGTVSSNETVISHFYNRKQGNIVVEYKLLGTDNEIEQSHTENKKWGENYDVTGLKRTDLDNYTYVSTIGQETGVVGSNEIKITHNYTKKVGRVTVRYIDKDTNQEISNSEVININYLDDYNVESKKLEIEKYVFDSNEGEITGNINKDNNNVVVTYKYSKKRGNITVNYYKDGTTNKIKDSYTEEKKFDETYDLTDKKVDIEKYNFVRTEGEMTGTVSGDVTINHYYTEKIGTVKIKYIDYNTDSELINPIVFTKKLTEGDLSYTSQAIGIDNYSFLKIKDGDEANGTIEEGEKIITYYYVKDNRRGISVRFEDEEGNILRPSITVNKTKTGYDINLDEMIKELITGDSIDYRFLQVRQGDKLSCNDSIDCLDKDDVVLLFEPRSIEIGVRNYLKNVEGEHTCNLFGMKYLSEEVNREEFENYLTYIDGGIPGFFNREVLLIGDDNQGGTHENSDKVTNLCIDTSKENGITSKHKIIYGKDGDQDTISMPREFKEGTFGGIRKFQEGDDDFDEGEEVGNEILNRVKFTKNNVSFHRLDILWLKNGKFQGNFDLNIELQPITKRIPIIYTNGNEEIRGTEEVSLTVGKSFNIENKKLDDIGDYEFSRVEGNLSGVLGNDMNEVRIVYVKKKGNVTVKYTGDRNESLDNDFTKQFEYGDSYQITPREFEDYDLTSIIKDGNITSDTNGIVNKDNHVIEFKYTKKQGNVVTQYIDSETGDIVSTKTNKVRYGDNYTAEKSEIPLYTHEREECVGEGVIDRNNQEVICKYYVTSNKSKVIVKITDSETGEIIRTEEIIGKVGSNYTINLSNIKNYDKDSNEGVELNGVFGDQNKEVTVTYTKKKGNVKIKFIDKETGKVIDEIITNGKAGDKINVNKKDIPGHTFHSSGDIDNLVIQEGENNIELFYTRDDGSVTVKYLDEDGKSIKDDTVITGKYGDDFEIKFEVPEGYSFVDSNGNIKGKIDGSQSISIKFRKNSIKGPGGYAPTRDINLNDDNRVKINTIISIKQGEEKKEEENNNKEKEKEKVKEPPMIILGDPETKFIFDPIAPIEIEEKVEIEGDNEERKNINIRFPKSGADISEEIVSFEDIINSNGNIPKDHKEQIIKKIKENFSENNGAISLEGNIVIEIDKINNKTDYTLEVTQTEYQSIGEKKVVKTPIKVSLDGFENKSFNYSLFLIILVSTFLSIFILMRRRKK